MGVYVLVCRLLSNYFMHKTWTWIDLVAFWEFVVVDNSCRFAVSGMV